MKRYILILFACVFLLNSCNRTDIPENEYMRVSMIQLIANPEKYHGKKVEVKGVAQIDFEDTWVYLCEDSWYHYSNEAIWLWIGAEIVDNELWWHINDELISQKEAIKKYRGKYVDILGVFDMDSKGHFDSSLCGAITVHRIVDRSEDYQDMYIDPNSPNYLPKYAEEYREYF